MWIYCKTSFIPVIKDEFLASLLQSSVTHDLSEIILICWFAAQETFLIIIHFSAVVLLNIFMKEKSHTGEDL